MPKPKHSPNEVNDALKAHLATSPTLHGVPAAYPFLLGYLMQTCPDEAMKAIEAHKRVIARQEASA